MKVPITRFDGLFGENEVNASSDFLQCEALEVRSRAYNWEIAEHFHADLYQLFFFRSGSGRYSIDQKEHDVRPFSVLFIPANTLHSFHFQEGAKGEVITASSRIIESILKGSPLVSQELNSGAVFEFSSQPDDFERVYAYYTFLKDELPLQRKEKWAVQRSLLELILLELSRSGQEAERRQMITSHRSLSYYQGFVTAVKTQMDQSQTIHSYASALGITVVHLNRVCREVAGKSALEVVHDLLIQEAKNYLLNTTYSIAEIAYFLNFNDPAYFNRLFKKKVGVPPGEFRRG